MAISSDSDGDDECCSVEPLQPVQDPWLALVVGANCFLPEFCAGFGKYLVCYRIEKARFCLALM